MLFLIEQIAVHPRDPVAAKKLLTDMGAARWVEDHVKAEGMVDGHPGKNEANLSFNYDMGVNDTKPLEFEVLNYTAGPNWMQNRPHSVSHIGMHVNEGKLAEWRQFFLERGIPIAQEVLTTDHTNPHIAGERWYQYVIFATRAILGVDVKFIVRKDQPPGAQS